MTAVMASGICSAASREHPVKQKEQSHQHSIRNAIADFPISSAPSEENGAHTFISAQSSLVHASGVATVDSTLSFILAFISSYQRHEKPLPVRVPLRTVYNKTLFRVIISPNAP